MVLVYNFSNSNVEYSLQWMSEHIKLMGQLSSMTVKVPRVSRDRGHTCLPPPPRACCRLPLTQKHPPALCQLSSTLAPQACMPQMTVVRLHWQEELG